MRECTENAYAKLNLSLDVIGRREDGYHDLAMLMQTVSLCDRVHLRFREDGRVCAGSNLHYIPGDERNLAVRAALRFLEAVGENGQGLQIDLKKEIPVGAGMGGGSADAAAALRGLNRLYGQPLDRRALEELAQQVGSDVAFCVAGGTALAEVPPPSSTGSWTAPRCASIRTRRDCSPRWRPETCARSAGGCTTCLRRSTTGGSARWRRSRGGCWTTGPWPP